MGKRLHKYGKFWAVLTILSLLISLACGGGDIEDGTAGDSGGSDAEVASFTCPEPSPRMEVTASEVNLFVWTEYIPQEAIDCLKKHITFR